VSRRQFVPNEDRVTPPGAATFALVMLATTFAVMRSLSHVPQRRV
jgi:hypothetical protein